MGDYNRLAKRPSPPHTETESGFLLLETLRRCANPASSCILKKYMAADFLTRIKQSPVLCDGAMGTLLYAKGIFINRSYDELNLSQPDLIRGIHHDYLQAGAEIIETNTFGANSFRLSRHSLADKVRDINRAGVRLVYGEGSITCCALGHRAG